MSTALRPGGDSPNGRPPLMLYWGGTSHPLPIRAIRAPSRSRPRSVAPAVPFPTGPLDRPFDFCGRVRRLCADIVARCPELGHIDMGRVLIGVMQARSARSHGLQARVTPLRFHGGGLLRKRKGICYQVQRYFVDSHEMLYLMTFCLPRFLDQVFDDKFVTLFHELYHIGPEFDGALRRHPGRYAVHSRSQRGYDQIMARKAQQYLAEGADTSLHAFLRLNFAQLEQRHGSVVGVLVPRPKVIPVLAAKRK